MAPFGLSDSDKTEVKAKFNANLGMSRFEPKPAILKMMGFVAERDLK